MNEAEARARKERRKAGRQARRVTGAAMQKLMRDLNRHAKFCPTCNWLIVEPGPCAEAQQIHARYTATQGETVH